MGNESSKPKRSASSRSTSANVPPAPPADPQKTSTSPQLKAVDTSQDAVDDQVFDPSPIDPSAPVPDAYNLPASSFSRPPRLPLPIEEEDHIPGSPILSPVDPVAPEPPAVDGNEVEEASIDRRSSVISSNVDEEEEPDEYQAFDNSPNAPKIPTIIEWRDAKPTDKVYVTGTFAGWERKYRLNFNGPSKHPNTLSATLQLPPGTHHAKFLVNNDMQTSPHLPTTVDFTNMLVNYIEVAQENVSPVAVPAPTPSKPLDIRPKAASEAASPARTSSPATTKPAGTASPSSATPARSSPKPSKPLTKKGPPKKYTNQIPQYLLDLDTWPPAANSPESSPELNSASSRFQRANAAAASQPAPPSLPLFLNKSILNGVTPIKDDASVLNFPNHTVLNHLATTNIKQGVLATSATTRYKQRFLTTILYKPRSDDGD